MFASLSLPLQPLRRLSLLIATLSCLANAAWAQTESSPPVQSESLALQPEPAALEEQSSAQQLESPTPSADQQQQDDRYWVRVELVVFTQPNPDLMTEYWDEQLRPQYAADARLLMPAEGFERTLEPENGSTAEAVQDSMTTADTQSMPQTEGSGFSADQLPAMASNTDEPETAEPLPGSLAYLPARSLPPLPEQDYADGAFILLSQQQRQQLLEAEPLQDRQGKPIQLLDLQRLERQGHRILFEGIWNQPVAEPEQSLPILIRGGEALDKDRFELDGEIRLSLSRFLHLHPNLYYTTELSDQWQVRDPHLLEALALAASAATSSMANQQPMDVTAANSLVTSSATSSLAQPLTSLPVEGPLNVEAETLIGSAPLDSELEPQADHRRFLTVKLDQPRRIRRDELHYLDHPLFGMLIRMVPIEPPVIEADELITAVSSQAQPSIPPASSAAAPSGQ